MKGESQALFWSEIFWYKRLTIKFSPSSRYIYIQGPLWMWRKAFLCFCLVIRVNQISHLGPAGIYLGFESILIIWEGNYDESSSSVNVGTLLNYVRSSSVLQVWFFVSFLVHCMVACANRMLLQSSCESNKISFHLFGFM